MALEIERKFLVTGDYKSLATSHSRIVQGYICSERGRTVRVRLRDERGYLTIKGPGIVDKIRWLVPAGRHTFEVDEFFGENEGLVVAEVELGSEDEAFERPDFLGKEVTGDRRYYNSSLRIRPYSQWEKE